MDAICISAGYTRWVHRYLRQYSSFSSVHHFWTGSACRSSFPVKRWPSSTWKRKPTAFPMKFSSPSDLWDTSRKNDIWPGMHIFEINPHSGLRSLPQLYSAALVAWWWYCPLAILGFQSYLFIQTSIQNFVFREEPEESPPPEDTIPEQELLRRSEEISKS